MRRRTVAAMLAGAAFAVGSCSAAPTASRVASDAASAGGSSTSATVTSATASATSATVTSTTSATASATTKPSSTAKPTPTSSAGATASGLMSLRGDTRDSWAFAPLSNPAAVTVEGSTASTKAYSTSKVLVVVGYLQAVAGGDPVRLSTTARANIRRALRESDGAALLALQRALPRGPSATITPLLRAIGDRSTTVPNSSLGGMLWSPREQVRFLAALANGRVVSAKASAYVLGEMSPIAEHRWGLGTIGASAFKGGWLTPTTVTRQMGIVDGYAVAIITAAVGPAVRQSDGDWAHVQQMNRLAAGLAARLSARG